MAYRKRRYRKSDASALIADTARTANKINWESALLLGTVLFVIFYWAVPAFMNHQLASLQGNQFSSLAEVRLNHMAHWARRLGIALWLVCVVIAGFNYFRLNRLSHAEQRGVSLFSRILARFLD